MKRFKLYIGIALIFSRITFGSDCGDDFDENKKIPDSSGYLIGDIDGDGKNEKIIWKKDYRIIDGDLYKVFIYKENGKLIWKTNDPSENFDYLYSFGFWNHGKALPEVLLDTNEDKELEIIAPLESFTLSPIEYRIFGWNGHDITIYRLASLIRSKEVLKRFEWVYPYSGSGVNETWVTSFKRVLSRDTAEVEIIEVSSRPKWSVKKGVAILRFDFYYGGDIVKWIKPLAPYRGKLKPLMGKIYIARIGNQDHYNLRGKNLSKLRDILYQDRVNYYRGLGDRGDTGTKPPFSLKKLKKLPIKVMCHSLKELKEMVMNGNPLLQIKVLNTKIEIDILYKN